MFTTRDLLIIPLGQQQYDVFSGQGWENWSRFKKEDRVMKLDKGQPLTKDNYDDLCKATKNT